MNDLKAALHRDVNVFH